MVLLKTSYLSFALQGADLVSGCQFRAIKPKYHKNLGGALDSKIMPHMKAGGGATVDGWFESPVTGEVSFVLPLDAEASLYWSGGEDLWSGGEKLAEATSAAAAGLNEYSHCYEWEYQCSHYYEHDTDANG